MPLPKVQTQGIDKKSLTDLQNVVALEAISKYNEMYNTNYTLQNIPDELKQYLELFVAITLYGWGETLNKDIKPATMDLLKSVFGDKAEEYKGINETIKSLLEGKDLSQIDQEAFAKHRTEVLFAGIFGAFNIVTGFLSKTDNRNWVGVITMNDGKVREEHFLNHRKYFNRSLKQPWNDFNCRCSYYYFKTEEEAKKAGFSKL